MLKANLITGSNKIADSKLGAFLAEQCKQAGIALNFVVAGKPGYKQAFNEYQNVITWGFKMPIKWHRRHEQNVLYIENSLINQRAGVFVDSQGWFQDSDIFNKLRPSCPEKVDLNHIAEKWFNLELNQPPQASGPILVCLQMERDAASRYHFPLDKDRTPNKTFLDLVAKYAPSENIIVRHHPKEKPELDLTQWNSNWQWDTNKSWLDSLKQASALVTINSTCATEACLTAIPIATFGKGCFLAFQATLDCSEDPSQLSKLFAEPVDFKARQAYLTTLLSNHFLSYEYPDSWESEQLNIWLDRCLQSAKFAEQQRYKALYASGTLPNYGKTNHGKHAIDFVQSLQPANLVDVGCGYNNFAKSIRPKISAIGFDFACPGADDIAFASNLPLLDKGCDLLTSFDCLEHLYPRDVTPTLLEFKRVSSRFLFSISYKDSRAKFGDSSLHPTIKPETWWKEQILTAGAVSVDNIDGYLFGRWK